MAVTTPLAAMVAMLVDADVQVPPVAVLLKVVVLPTQTVATPVMVAAVGSGLTVTVLVATSVPQLLVTL